jgi:alkylhydroperoxidase family enzyme
VSVEAMAIAMHHSRARGTARLVLIGIANHDGDGGSWPAIATLCKYAGGVDRKNVKRAIDELEQLHEVEQLDRAGGDRRTPDHLRPNLYRFLLRCPPDCDRTTAHRTRSGASVPEQLDLSTQGAPAPRGAADPGALAPRDPGAPAPPEPSLELPTDNSRDLPQTASLRATWTHACVDGTSNHAPRRKTGACAYCGATRITYRMEP